jgi:hypothetical protein
MKKLVAVFFLGVLVSLGSMYVYYESEITIQKQVYFLLGEMSGLSMCDQLNKR